VKRKNAETIAYFHDQERQALQKFIGQWLWVPSFHSGKMRRETESF
jgi:hypothetical protein